MGPLDQNEVDHHEVDHHEVDHHEVDHQDHQEGRCSCPLFCWGEVHCC